MRLDAQNQFVAPGAPLSLVASVGTSIPSATVDLYGQGVNTTVTNIIGTPTVWGTDFGIGERKAQLEVVIGTQPTTSDSCTLNVALQLAIDAGAGVPGTWITAVETGPIAVANLPAQEVIARFDFPPEPLPQFQGTQPRFARLLFQVPASEQFTAGSIAFAIVTLARDDWAQKYAAKNFTLAG